MVFVKYSTLRYSATIQWIHPIVCSALTEPLKSLYATTSMTRCHPLECPSRSHLFQSLQVFFLVVLIRLPLILMSGPWSMFALHSGKKWMGTLQMKWIVRIPRAAPSLSTGSSFISLHRGSRWTFPSPSCFINPACPWPFNLSDSINK